MTIEDIMNLSTSDLRKLSPKAQRELTSRLVSASNKRIRRAEKNPDIKSKEITRAKKRGGFSIAGKTDVEVRREFRSAKTFLQKERSSITGVKQQTSDRIDKARATLRKEGVAISRQKFEEDMKTYNRLKEIDTKFGDKNLYDSTVVIGAIKKYKANTENVLDLMKKITAEADKRMKDKQKEFDEQDELPNE